MPLTGHRLWRFVTSADLSLHFAQGHLLDLTDALPSDGLDAAHLVKGVIAPLGDVQGAR